VAKKLDEKRKQYKDLEARTSKHIQELERERAVLDEKLRNAARKAEDECRAKDATIAELEDRLSGETGRMSSTAQALEEQVAEQKL
jgi:predicted RNase H-like nuclease (RuvC/YqgF family)